MKKTFLFAAAAAVLSACSVDPQAAYERRQALIKQIFPNPADQQGLHLVFPIESGGFYSILEVIYFADEVSESTVKQRVGNYCAKFKSRNTSGQAFTRKPSTPVNATLLDGTTRPAQQIWLSCYRKK